MEVAGANRRRPLLLFFGSRESAVAQLFSLGCMRPSNIAIIRKAPIIGALLGILFTTGITVFYLLNPPQHLFDFSGLLMELAMMPATIIVRVFGISAHWFVNDATGGIAVFPLCTVFFTNLVVGFLFGCLIRALTRTARKID
jgi:hypothetical protein